MLRASYGERVQSSYTLSILNTRPDLHMHINPKTLLTTSIWDFLEPFIRLLSGESSHSQAWAIASFPCVFLGNMVRSTDAEATLPGSRSWLYLLWFNNPKSLLPYLLKKCLCHRFVQRMA